ATTSVTVQTTSGNITVADNGVLGASATGGHSLSLSAGGAGVVNLDFGISSSVGTSFLFSGSAINLGGASGVALSTTGAGIFFNSPTNLVGGGSTLSTSGGNIQFNSTLNGNQPLGLTAGVGNVSFADVGQTTRLG